ncbi:hypothetical protein HMH01_07485 [Halovulum dunhuangense]|uniref:Uncharacterized protein n=1 Tax=Halovulum dunhuangense TaxID=1505036 RepID=A0A849L200_9RHOB|nr:DUF6635 family protein [Halovulum dunhuangense]NNU80280.1 hypothetical protein [Halovulum dunhuangense]
MTRPAPFQDEDALRAWLDACRARIQPFARRHLSLAGSARLHRAALGWDVVRAPVNLLLSPLLVICRLAGHALRALGLRRAGGWLVTRNFLLRTDVARRLEIDIRREVLQLRAAPLRPTDPLETWLATALREYSGSRAAVAEMTVALVALSVGGAVFHALTPGMVSLGPNLADAMALEEAIQGFPLGNTAGAVWYTTFPPEAGLPRTALVTLGMVAFGAMATAFAGILADPLQTRLGLHQRRLHRLIDGLEDTLLRDGRSAFRSNEHYMARLLDMIDASLGVARGLGG